jgi:hypothetical protein
MGMRPGGTLRLFVGRWNLQDLQPKAMIFEKLKIEPSIGL